MKLTNRDFTYIPACSLGGIPDTARKEILVNGYKPNWWQKGKSFFYYPYILQSAHYVSGDGWRKGLGIGDDVYVFGDSGGFQAINYEFDMDPISVLRWQERECNIGIILDNPPVKMDSSWTSYSTVSEEEFEAALEQTRKNVDIIIDKRQKKTQYDLKLYNVLQGTTKDELTKWYDVMSQYELDGWSIGVKPPSPMMVAFVTSFLIDRGIDKDVHLLGLSGMSSGATAIYASKFIKNMVIDSSSYNRGCTAREYNLPLDMRDKLWLGDKGDNLVKMSELREWPCICPVCLNLPDPAEVDKMSGTLIGVLISLHNLWCYVQMVQQMSSLVHSEDVFNWFVDKKCTKETRKAIEFIDYSMDNGWEDAVNKYHNKGAGSLDEFY